MKKLISFVVGIVVPAFIMAGGMANSAVAQEKAAKASVKPKVLLENAKVRVYEVTYNPGDENTGVVSTSTRIIRPLKGGTLQLTYADGKKETVVRKAGEPYMLEPGPAYTTKNIGKTVVQLYIVQLK
jgi:negative regulator of sigma E activity